MANLIVDGEDIHDVEVVRSHELMVSMVPLCSSLSLWLAGVPSTVEVLWPVQPGDKNKDVPWAISTELDDLGDPLVLKGQDSLLVVVAWSQRASLWVGAVWADSDNATDWSLLSPPASS